MIKPALILLPITIVLFAREIIIGEGQGNTYCTKIDTLIKEHFEWKSGNYYANKIIPVLEKESGIEASCDKGTFGHLYKSDSSFNTDIQKWKEYFECNK